MKSIVVIPTYNEAENIVFLLGKILKETSLDVLVVDDNSPDGTAQLIKQLNNHRINIKKRIKKRGLGSAYKDGFAWALNKNYDFIGQMDADFSHNPHDLQKMKHLLHDADLVVGSRYIPEGKIVGWGPWRHFCSRSAMIVSRIMLRLPTKDVTSGFRVWRRDLLKEILSKNIESSGYAFQEEMLYHAHKLNAGIIEHPITFNDRKAGKSKLGWGDVSEFFIVIAKLTLRK